MDSVKRQISQRFEGAKASINDFRERYEVAFLLSSFAAIGLGLYGCTRLSQVIDFWYYCPIIAAVCLLPAVLWMFMGSSLSDQGLFSQNSRDDQADYAWSTALALVLFIVATVLFSAYGYGPLSWISRAL